jgi:D-proline reductase (dithiol) PrdB
MARLEQLDEASRTVLLKMECPVFETRPWVTGPPLNKRRVAIVTTAGLHRRTDRPFLFATSPEQAKPVDYRVIPADTKASDLVMSHTSTNFDRIGFQQDSNLVFPIDRLRELQSDGVIGSVADFHYSSWELRILDSWNLPRSGWSRCSHRIMSTPLRSSRSDPHVRVPCARLRTSLKKAAFRLQRSV